MAPEMKSKDFTRVSRPSFRIERAVSQSLQFTAHLACICCGQPMVVRFGDAAALFRVGGEVIGACCPDCLDAESRQTLAELRERVVR
jgi:hypothetical protein